MPTDARIETMALCAIHEVHFEAEVVARVDERGMPVRWTRFSCGHLAHETWMQRGAGAWEQVLVWYPPESPPTIHPWVFDRPRKGGQ